jgi:MerR family copper efflux transcriptional regulator
VIARTKSKSLTIGRLAQQAGVNLETVRFYERQGLLPKPPRSTSGYRLFPAEATRRLRFIKRAQELGFSLNEIRELLALRMSPRTSSAEIRKRAEAKIVDIESKIKSLDSMRRSLHKLAKSCAGCGPVSDCPILENLDGDEA